MEVGREPLSPRAAKGRVVQLNASLAAAASDASAASGLAEVKEEKQEVKEQLEKLKGFGLQGRGRPSGKDRSGR